MKIILGLGNPGVEYVTTRHNAGVMLVDKIFNVQYSKFINTYGWRKKKNIMVAEFPDLVLVKTAEYFMNESGRMIKDVRNMNYEMGDLYLAHDDLDIKLGDYKIQKGIGPKVHNGVESVEGVMQTKDFWRIRIGIDNRETKVSGEDYVLQRFSKEEKIILDGVLEKILNEIN